MSLKIKPDFGGAMGGSSVNGDLLWWVLSISLGEGSFTDGFVEALLRAAMADGNESLRFPIRLLKC